MPHAVRIHAAGGPEALVYEDVPPPEAGIGEVVLRQHAIGVNFVDIYRRTGLYPLDKYPAVLGSEGAGEIIALGEGVEHLQVGDRVAYAAVVGGYTDVRSIAADRLVRLPDEITYETAASMMLRGMTARMLLRDIYRVGAETTMLFHAAAGGAGLIACQWAHALGATVIGTVSSPEKAALAAKNGCAHVINVKSENFVERVRDLTSGRGCDVVYDSIGKDTFPQSLDCLRPRGLWASFGSSSGPVPPFSLSALKGSLFATRPSLFAFTVDPEWQKASAAELFDVVLSGKVRVQTNHRYPLAKAEDAHRDLEARRTTGSVILVP
jgi:NADPH:quinone reductase